MTTIVTRPRGAIAVVSALLAMAFSMNGAAAETVLKFGIFTPPQEPTNVHLMKPFADAATKDSKGTIRIETYPGGTLGRNPRAQLKLMYDGVADMTWMVPSYTPGRFPDNSVFELPGFFKNATEASLTIWRMYKKGMLRGYDNMKVVMLVCTHPYGVHAKTPITKVSDFKGRKVRAGGPIFATAIRAMGGTPVGMPAPAVAESLSRGVIDSVAFEWNGYVAFRTAEVAKFHYMANLGCAPLLLGMNKKRYESLPKAGRDAIDKNSGELSSVRFGKLHDKINSSLLAKYSKASDHKVVVPAGEDLKRLNAIQTQVVADWGKKSARNAKLIEAVKAEVRNIRAGK